MRGLIVNADDLGASPGTSRGILTAHEGGIVTSASLMVETPWSAEGAALSRAAPRLSVGLHAEVAEQSDATQARADLLRQLERFEQVMGRRPTHIDSHHNAHLDARWLPVFLELSRHAGVPLRGHSSVRYFPGFYGQWAGESHPEHVSVENLGRMLRLEIGDGVTEMSCHPGHVDSHLVSGYGPEREVELRTLCDPACRTLLAALDITLMSYHDLARAAVAGAQW